MKIRVLTISSTADVGTTASELAAAFDQAFATAANGEPDFKHIESLNIYTTISHPALYQGRPRRASFHKPTGAYVVSAHIDYTKWIAPDWSARAAAYGEAIKRAVESASRTRVEEDECASVLRLTDLALLEVQRNPPNAVQPIQSVYQILDATTGKHISLLWSPQRPPDDANVVEVKPEDAMSLAYLAVAPTEDGVAFPIKLYRRVDGVLHYHEAWTADDTVVEHWGICGDQGESRTHSTPRKADLTKTLRAIRADARARGYRPIPPSRHAMLIVEYPETGPGGRGVTGRHEAEDALDQITGCLGLGHVDGGSTGLGTMEIACPVVDFAIAKTAIATALANSRFADFSRIYRER